MARLAAGFETLAQQAAPQSQPQQAAGHGALASNGPAPKGAQGTPYTARQTLADDVPLSPLKQQQIAAQEELVRAALALFEIDYDALIKHEPGAPYAEAVAANPQLLKEVAASETPVLAALQAAVAFKPVAEFQQKYGNTPDEVRAKVRAEVLQEIKEQDNVPPTAAKDARGAGAVPFSGLRPVKQSADEPPKQQDLSTLFGR